MSYTLNVPTDIYHRAQEIAQSTSQTVDKILLEHLTTLALLPADEQAELSALRYLSDDALWTIAAEQMPVSAQEEMQVLMEKNNRGTLSDDEREKLEALVDRGNRLMLRKAEASNILIERGHQFTQQDFQRKHE